MDLDLDLNLDWDWDWDKDLDLDLDLDWDFDLEIEFGVEVGVGVGVGVGVSVSVSVSVSVVEYKFIQNHFYPKPVSSKTTFIPKTIFVRDISKQEQKQYSPCLCESVAGRKPAMLHMKVC